MEQLPFEQIIQLPIYAGLLWYFTIRINTKLDKLADDVYELRERLIRLEDRVQGNGLKKQLEDLKIEFEKCRERRCEK